MRKADAESAAGAATSGADSDRRVIVAGGGPAGATLATLLALRGVEVVLLERERFPRFHIGESLMTETWWIFQKLGLIEKLESSDFPRKYSVQFVSDDGSASRPFYFFETIKNESAVTWQVDRAEFDEMLLQNAREKGVDVRLGAKVRRVLFERSRAVGVEVESESGGVEELRARVIADATGLHSLLARQLKLIEPDPKLQKAAVYAHYEGAYRDPGIDEGATLIIHTRGNRGWFWNIPLNRNRVSVGVVGPSGELLKGRGRPEDVLDEEIRACETMRARLEGARRTSPVRVVNDFSYRAKRIAGDGWVLVGDAFGFIDPVYSTGVFLALKSAEMAAATIAEGLAKDDVSARQLGRFGAEFAEGMEAMRKLVYAFYTPGFSFADFVRRHPEHSPRLVDLLTGNVFKEGVTGIFADMERMCQLPEARPLDAPDDELVA